MRLALAVPAAVIASLPSTAHAASPPAHVARVTITRDDWGIAHVRGRSDADAVFGAMFAQAEDDFPRVEANLLTALGRTAEAEGEDAIWGDLRQRLYIDPERLKADYAASPAWLRKLMDAWAAGLNWYLATHPQEKPRVIARFEPWMALSFTEGSIGGDIERADLKELAAFYGGQPSALALAHEASRDEEPKGSNGIAIAPKLSASGNPLLLINPHTSFFFRSELGMESAQGLRAYGASTWGQFFIYQGFNDRMGWMHTSSGVDSVDEFAETIVQDGGTLSYRHGGRLRPVTVKPVTLRFRKPDGTMGERTFETYATHHGPVVRARDGKWIALALMNTPIKALQQSWLRTKARSRAEYLKVAALQANSSNATLYAGRDGHVGYLHPQFVPRRDDRFDYRDPVDGSDPAADWQGLTPLAALPQVSDPAAGWVYNANDDPWRAAAADSPRKDAFPRYMDEVGPNSRGDHATALLSAARPLTAEGLRQIAYDPWMPLFADLIPGLPDVPAGDPLSGPIALLRGWDHRWSVSSEATSLAAFWADELRTQVRAAMAPHANELGALRASTPAVRREALARAVARMEKDWGGWRVPWGEINRFQRISPAIVHPFDDSRPSVPVGFASARWGSLASFGAKAYPGTRRWYGTSGNSFVAIVEFGPKVKAWAVSAGGESGRPGSPHFADQAGLYAEGRLRPVYFYPEDLKGHVERTYRPGE